MKKWILIFVVLSFLFDTFAQETAKQKDCRMQWFKDAKLGIFIHWGIYAVKGINESWSFYNNEISYSDYMDQLKGFTADKYNPDYWADLIKQSGARYAVLTAKHHDGVALWNSRQSALNVVKKTPAQRDLIQPYVNALRERDLKVGLYFSLLDWSHPDYPHHTRQDKRYDPQSKPERWQRFLYFQKAQLKEVVQNYTPDLIWFDGDWDYGAELWESKQQREMLFSLQSEIIINSRFSGYGDYATPENGLPIIRPKEKYWELCLTMNDSWGYQPKDNHYKSVHQIIGVLVECLYMGGNLLLDIGPKEGTIPKEQIQRLQGLGRWVQKHQPAVYGVRAGLPHGYFYGLTSLSADSTILYLYIPHIPKREIALKGIENEIIKINVVGTSYELQWDIHMKQSWSKIPGIVYIQVPESVLDREWTVLAVFLDGKIDLYR